MPRKAKSKDEIEFVFGFKQVLGTAILVAIVFGGAYFWGFETGHKRALTGQPSLLAFLESGGDPTSEPVAIPDVLLNPIEGIPAKSANPDTAPSRPVQVTSASQPQTDHASDNQPKERVKPEPGIKARTEEPEASPPEAETLPIPVPSARPSDSEPATPQPSSKNKLHYQVAALKVRTNAKTLVDWLRSEGFKARIEPASEDGLFRVYVGPFRSDTAAASAKDRLTKDGFKLMARNL